MSKKLSASLWQKKVKINQKVKISITPKILFTTVRVFFSLGTFSSLKTRHHISSSYVNFVRSNFKFYEFNIQYIRLWVFGVYLSDDFC